MQENLANLQNIDLIGPIQFLFHLMIQKLFMLLGIKYLNLQMKDNPGQKSVLTLLETI